VLDDLLPAPQQGAIGIEVLAENKRVRTLLGAIDHRPTHICVAAERSLLEGLGGDCRSPVAALATCEGETIRLRAELLTNDGSQCERAEVVVAPGDEEAIQDFARALLDRAHPDIRALFAG